MPTFDESIYDAALRAVSAACAVARQLQIDLADGHAMTKADRSPVTVADFAVQAIIARAILDVDPAAHIIGEEDAAVLHDPDCAVLRRAVLDAVRKRAMSADALSDDAILSAIDHCDHDATADAFWAVDPIDGTKGFVRGGQFSIALAHIVHGEVVAGFLGCPVLDPDPDASVEARAMCGVVQAARRGGGAWQWRDDDVTAAPMRLTISDRDAITPARFCGSVERSTKNESLVQRILDAAGVTYRRFEIDSQCKYAVVAAGRADGYIRIPRNAAYREKIWDHAAGDIIATEAGTVVSDVFGRPLDFARGAELLGNRGVICATPGLHEQLVTTILEQHLLADSA